MLCRREAEPGAVADMWADPDFLFPILLKPGQILRRQPIEGFSPLSAEKTGYRRPKRTAFL